MSMGRCLELLKSVNLGLGRGRDLLELFGLFGLNLLQMLPGGLLIGIGAPVLRLGEALLGFLDLRLHFFRGCGEVFERGLTQNACSFLHRYGAEVGNQGLYLLDGVRIDFRRGQGGGSGGTGGSIRRIIARVKSGSRACSHSGERWGSVSLRPLKTSATPR